MKELEGTVSAIGQLITLAGNSEQAKEAAKNVGKTAVVVTEAINNFLLPLAAVNFAMRKAKDYFSGQFQEDLSRVTKNIPPENIVEPKASIAGPALQGLAFSHEEPDLKEMYLNLIASSMNQKVSDDVHPAFVEVIKQLSSSDAKLLRCFSRRRNMTSVAQIVGRKGREGSQVFVKHLLDFDGTKCDEDTKNLWSPSVVVNWIRLGLFEVEYGFAIRGEYPEWAKQRPQYHEWVRNMAQSEWTVDVEPGVMTITEFGLNFALSVGIEW